jgi:hypothetical protein
MALRSDRDDIVDALRTVPKTKRPRVHDENHAMLADLHPNQGCEHDAPQNQPPR